MKDLFIKDLKTDETATFQAAVREKQSKDKKDGSSYLIITLVDKTGTIDARMWDDLASANGIEADDVVKVQGPLSTYRDKLQLTIKKIRKCGAEEIDDADYLPASERDREEMWGSLREIVDGIVDVQIKDVVMHLIHFHETELKKAPAAMKVHHAFVGGLIEHILSLTSLSCAVCDCYPNLNLDLMLAMCVIHDMGKIRELVVSRSLSYSVEGTLIGHVAIGLELLDSAVAVVGGMDPKTLMKLKHMLISHHGKLEYGALKLPALPEAIAFNMCDDMDAKMQVVKQAFAEFSKEEGLTPWVSPLSTQLYKG